MSQAILFTTCLGLNDARSQSSQKADPRTGKTELIDCLNMTITPDSCVEKIPGFVSKVIHSAAVTRVSAGSRLFFQDAVDTYELSGVTATNRFPAVVGPIAHTPLDARISAPLAVYKSLNSTPTMQQALVGTYSGPPVSTTFSAMPLFDNAFVLNSRLYAAKGNFLQYSLPYAYDLWAIGDNFIGHASVVIQSGCIPAAGPLPAVVICTHENGVSLYTGSGPENFAKSFYPCDVLAGSLYSGFISKADGYGHLFLCSDGVYLVNQEGTLTNLSKDSTDNLGSLNTSCAGAIVHAGKYLAFGNAVCVEYDFQTKAVMKRAPFGVSSSCLHNGTPYLAQGSQVITLATEIDTGNTFESSLALPYSDLGKPGRKSFSDMYFTGEVTGELVITARDQDQDDPERWEVTVDDIGKVQNYRIKLPRAVIGSKVSFELKCTSGAFRLEELQAIFGAGNRR